MIATHDPRGERHSPDRVSRGQDGSGRSGPRPEAWHPLVGANLLDRLRHTGRARPGADPELAADLRAILESGLDVAPADGSGSGLAVTKHRLTGALTCPSHRWPDGSGVPAFTVPRACGALVDALFRQLVTTGSVEDPLAEGREGLSLDEHQAPLVAWIDQLGPAERNELRAEVDRQSDGLRRRWPNLDPAWLPRTRETLRLSLDGGRVELSTRVDLALGRPGGDVATVAMVEVTSGWRRRKDQDDRHFDALIETLRGSVAPFVVATYFTRTGELDVDPVTPELLIAAARRCRAGIDALATADAGGGPMAFDHPFCGACADSPLGAPRLTVGAPPVTAPSRPGVLSGGTDGIRFVQDRAA
jgi:hypothetical protein